MAIPVVLVLHPPATILSVGWMIGIYGLAAGMILIAQGLRLRHSADGDGAERPPEAEAKGAVAPDR